MQTVQSSAAHQQELSRQAPSFAVPARPPVITRPYRGLFKTFAEHPGEWFAVTLECISGRDLRTKRTIILQAARNRGLRLQTSTHDGKLFARLIVETAVR